MQNQEIDALDDLESNHWWYLIRKENLLRWASLLPSSSKILDLGSASGGNTLYLKDKGFDIVSVENSMHAIGIQLTKGLNPIQADARSLPFKDSTFNGIYCMDVLEHIQDDVKVISEIYRVLKPAGQFLCSVPEDPKLWSAHDVALDHVRRYTRPELIEKIVDGGFKLDSVYSRNTFLKPVLIVLRRFTKSSDLKKHNVLINWMLLIFCRIEMKVNVKNIPGVTLWAEASKK